MFAGVVGGLGPSEQLGGGVVELDVPVQHLLGFARGAMRVAANAITAAPAG